MVPIKLFVVPFTLINFATTAFSSGERDNSFQENANLNTYESLRRCHIFGKSHGMPEIEYILDIGMLATCSQII